MTTLALKRPLSWIREQVRYLKLHREVAEKLSPRDESTPGCDIPDHVVVSLKRLPSRLPNIRPTLNPLLDQSRNPDATFLNLPTESRRKNRGAEISPFLHDYRSVEVVRCGRERGP